MCLCNHGNVKKKKKLYKQNNKKKKMKIVFSFFAPLSSESCPGELAHFTGKVGIFITGKVEPSLSGVQVTVSSPDNAAMEPVTLETDENGVYR